MAGSWLRELLGKWLTPGVDPLQRAERLCEALLSERGEASGAALARELLAAYRALDDAGRARFYDVLAARFATEPQRVHAAADRYRADASLDNLLALQESIEAPRRELFRRLNQARGGTAALVEMRQRILQGLKDHPGWRALDADLLRLLRAWFNRGFLKLERIDWRSPALVLEKLIAYEAVHEIRGWPDLRRRLEGDRRCFAFFHPGLPEEPLVFIEVALTRGMAASVQPLLDVHAPVSAADEADHAIFYSITNCQEGLRGISFGNFLIKHVAEELKRELPNLKHFATLSPAPDFRRWLKTVKDNLGSKQQALLEKTENAGWHLQADAELQGLVMRLAAHYFLHAKRGAEPFDPVARFHQGNGAQLARLNWLGDTSPAGMARSAGLMVNYEYDLKQVERNHERYVKEHRVAASREIEKLAAEVEIGVRSLFPRA